MPKNAQRNQKFERIVIAIIATTMRSSTSVKFCFLFIFLFLPLFIFFVIISNVLFPFEKSLPVNDSANVLTDFLFRTSS